MKKRGLEKFFPVDHFIDNNLVNLINLVIDVSPGDFPSTKPQQMIMGAVMCLLVEMKWAKHCVDPSGHPGWVATGKGRAAMHSFYEDLAWEADCAAAADAISAETVSEGGSEPKAAVEVDCN
jgi:hypothetical protein